MISSENRFFHSVHDAWSHANAPDTQSNARKALSSTSIGQNVVRRSLHASVTSPARKRVRSTRWMPWSMSSPPPEIAASAPPLALVAQSAAVAVTSADEHRRAVRTLRTELGTDQAARSSNDGWKRWLKPTVTVRRPLVVAASAIASAPARSAAPGFSTSTSQPAREREAGEVGELAMGRCDDDEAGSGVFDRRAALDETSTAPSCVDGAEPATAARGDVRDRTPRRARQPAGSAADALGPDETAPDDRDTDGHADVRSSSPNRSPSIRRRVSRERADTAAASSRVGIVPRALRNRPATRAPTQGTAGIGSVWASGRSDGDSPAPLRCCSYSALPASSGPPSSTGRMNAVAIGARRDRVDPHPEGRRARRRAPR